MKLPGTVLGVRAPRAKPTLSGAFWLATMTSIPIGGLGFLVDWLLRTGP
ncbi:MAG: hypothetical protein ABJM43_04855 [Paracoccaceae bacterium]